MLDLVAAQVVCREGQQRQVTRPFDGDGQAALMFGARPGLAARANLPSIRQVAAKGVGVFVGYFLDFVQAKIADFAAPSAKTSTGSAPATASVTIIKIVHVTIIIAHRFSLSIRLFTTTLLESVVALILAIFFVIVRVLDGAPVAQ